MAKQYVEMMGKTIQLEVSAKAEKQLNSRLKPLFVEMELYFSCLLRKQLRVYEGDDGMSRQQAGDEFQVALSDLLHLSFRPVMTKACSISSCDGEKPPLSDFPIEKPHSYIPKWLKLDYKKGKWCGDFGY